jgi:septal ring factor EnvC (AmiA/AmiB activator)
METNLHELATNALLNHWPPHLGVKTDREKVAYLAERLREAGDTEARIEKLETELESANEENGRLTGELKELKATLGELKPLIAEMKDNLADLEKQL